MKKIIIVLVVAFALFACVEEEPKSLEDLAPHPVTDVTEWKRIRKNQYTAVKIIRYQGQDYLIADNGDGIAICPVVEAEE